MLSGSMLGPLWFSYTAGVYILSTWKRKRVILENEQSSFVGMRLIASLAVLVFEFGLDSA